MDQDRRAEARRVLLPRVIAMAIVLAAIIVTLVRGLDTWQVSAVLGVVSGAVIWDTLRAIGRLP